MNTELNTIYLNKLLDICHVVISYDTCVCGGKKINEQFFFFFVKKARRVHGHLYRVVSSKACLVGSQLKPEVLARVG